MSAGGVRAAGTQSLLGSNLNCVRGQAVPNLVLVPVGPDGSVSLLSNAGNPHVIADVVEYVAR